MIPRPEQLTLEDVARLAGVGLGTASRALNNAPGVAAKTRERVLEVAKAHDYVLSPTAANLAGGSTGRVALVVPHTSRWFFGTMVETLDAEFSAAGLDVLLFHVGSLDERERFFELLPARRKVDAVVVVGFPVTPAQQARLALLGVEIVAAGGGNAAYPHVSIDDEAAGRLAVDHLIGLGHRDIAMIAADDPEQPNSPRGRAHAWEAALRDAGIEPDPRLRVSIAWGGEEGAEAMAHLLGLPRCPSAVYAHSDEVAAGAIRTIRRVGLRVPEDMSVIGIDDHPIASLIDLTTVRQPLREQAEQTAAMLVALLRGEPLAARSVLLPTELVVRGTTAPPAR